MLKKTIIITGAKQGIGKAIAQHFAKRGYNIVINDKEDREELERVGQQLKEDHNVEVLSCFGDVSNEAYVEKMFEEVIEKFDNVDVLVNNAGIVEDMDVEKEAWSFSIKH